MRASELKNKRLGSIVVKTSTGPFHNSPGKLVELDLQLICEDKANENKNGEIDMLYAHVRGYFNEDEWSEASDGLIYEDRNVCNQVNQFLKNLMYPGTVGYSEMGMQEGFVDFDAPNVLVAYFYPELVHLVNA